MHAIILSNFKTEAAVICGNYSDSVRTWIWVRSWVEAAVICGIFRRYGTWVLVQSWVEPAVTEEAHAITVYEIISKFEYFVTLVKL